MQRQQSLAFGSWLTRAALIAALFGMTVGCEPGPPDVTVMTRNLYFGFSEASLLAAEDFEQLAVAVAEGWQSVVDTDFPDRAQALAREIEATGPDLIGLQEVAIYRVQSPGDLAVGGDAPATEVVYDFLEILLSELRGRGLNYEEVASITEMDIELPSATGDDVRLTDRDVILRRTGRFASRAQVLATDGGHFETLLQLPVGGEGGPTLTLLRGWVSADIRLAGRTFRFVNTHLDDFALVQEAQALELLAGPLDTDLPAILLGDLNSDAFGEGTQTYEILLDAGFVDAWTEIAPADAGLTWGHEPDLSNPSPTLTQRLDLIVYRGAFEAGSAEVVGEEIGDRTGTGLWPSDHAGVVATLAPPTVGAR